MLRTIIGIALTVGLFACNNMVAQDDGFSAQDRAAVEARIAELDAVVSTGDIAGAVEVVPPRMLRQIASNAGVSENQLLDMIRQQSASISAGMEIESFDIDLDGAPPQLTPNGRREYLLLPTTSVIAMGGQTVRSTTSTLALEDDGEWYLIRVDNPQQADLITEIWPEFEGVDFPTGTRTLQ